MADSSTPCSNFKSIDRVMYQTLSKIFHQRCFTEAQVKKFLRTSEHTDRIRNCIIQLIPELEFSLCGLFSKAELGKLSLLWIAIFGHCHKSAELLVRLGADVNELCELQELLVYFGDYDEFYSKFENSWTILHVLLQMKPTAENESLIRLVTDHDADLEARDGNGKTALHYAIREGRTQTTEMLLEKGADVNVSDDDGWTPLFFAASDRKAAELLPLLMKHGADFFAKSRRDDNAWLCLASNSDVEHPADAAKVLIEKGVSLYDNKFLFQPIHQAVVSGNNELVKIFLDHGVDMHAQIEDGKFPLYLAALRIDHEIDSAVLETLLKRGANVHQRTITGRTALHAICTDEAHVIYFRDEGIRLLLSAGADVLAEDCNGNTPLSLINHQHLEDEEEIPSIRLMIKMLALNKVRQPSIELKDERIIQRYPSLWDYYRDCFDEICSMKATSFIETCTFFELLTKGQSRIAALMRNPSFETKFGEYDLSEFFTYAEDIKRAFENARNRYQAMLEQEDVINEAVYNTLPDLIVREVVRYIFND